MKDETSLWNLTKNKKKIVLEYISDLIPFDRWTIIQKRAFEKIIREALNPKLTANENLRLIGYQFRKQPEVYDRVDMEKK